jgi:alpha-beta hydrolase superfamily lysophospholipase
MTPWINSEGTVCSGMAQPSENLVSIPVDDVELEGMLEVSDGAPGIVVFAHGSGSSRKSPRNNFVAEVIRERGLGTLLFDLLTEEEDRVRENRFDIPLLTDRLLAATEWLRARDDTADLTVGYFGSSTGAASALRAVAHRSADVDSVVSRGGRVDLAEEVLDEVRAPTLFIVGGADTQVLELNREAYDRLSCEKELHVVAGAGHLFEGEGELEEVANLAADWFAETLQYTGRRKP